MLKLLSFKVSGNMHAKISSVAKWLCSLAFLGVMGFFLYTGFNAYKEINSLGSDYSTLEAELLFNRVEQQTSRRKNLNDIYHYDYKYVVAGKNYSGTFSVNEENVDPYYEADSVAIAYSNTDPALSKRLSIVEKGYSFTSYILRMLLVFVIVGFFALLIFGFITEHLFINRDAPPEEDEEELIDQN